MKIPTTVFLGVLLCVFSAGIVQAEPILVVSVERALDRMEAAGVFAGPVAEDSGQSAKPAKKKEPEKFFGRRNMILGGILIGADVADIETTFPALKHPEIREGNAIARMLTNHGRKVIYPVSIGANMLLLNAGVELRKSKNKTVRVLGWVLPIAFAGVHSYAAVKNDKLHQRYH